jgi:homoserine/homoserine lactone efflux protein
VMLVIATAFTRGARDGMQASLGILAANAVYFALSATSVGALLAASPRTFTAVKWLGAVYLVVIGAQAIRSAFVRSAENVAPALTPDPAPQGRAFVRGFATQAANPKALLFFIAILPQFIDLRGRVALQVAILGVSSLGIEFVVLALYVAAAARARSFTRDPRWSAAFDALGGALLVFAGVGLAALRP